MKYTWLFPVFFLFLLPFAQAQQTNIRILPGIRIPITDSIVKAQLFNDLNDFLAQKNKSVDSNTRVAPEYALETAVLLDELNGIEGSTKYKNPYFYRCYLNNLIVQSDGLFSIQFSYRAVYDSTPLLRASFHLLAKKTGDHYYFYSPLLQLTRSWKTSRIANVTFHYKDRLNEKRAIVYAQKLNAFDTKLGLSGKTTEFYCCDNFNEAQQLIGLLYKVDYSGIAFNSLSASHGNKSICVAGADNKEGFNDVDIHDLWHDRLHSKVSVNRVNRPVDEGCAYLYGGSWGIPWPQITALIKRYAAAHPDANWLNLYNESYNFSEDTQRPLKADFAINAFLVKMIEAEKGFPKVMELLCCGKQEAGNENYFRTLAAITGITKEDFNAKVRTLILAEK